MAVSIASRLQERRRHLGLSQEALAREIGVSKNTVARWEAGGQMFADVAVRLADALGVDPRWLITGEAKAKAAAA